MTEEVKVGWRMVKLGDLGQFLNGVNFSKEKKGSGIRLINVKDIFNGLYLDFNTLDKVNLGEKKGIEKYYVRKGDLFFVRSSVKRDGIGLVSLVRESENQTIHCGFIIRFRISSNDADNLFLAYLLRSQHYRQLIIGISGGAAIINITQKVLSDLEIILPPLPSQRKIAAILSAYDDLIENNTRRIKILDEMAQAIYKEWFVKFRFPGHEKVKMVDSELGKIPEEWEVKRLGDVCNIVMGQSPSSKFYNTDGEGLPFHQGVKDFGTRFPSHKTYCTVDKRVADEGDVLVSVRAPVGRINIANSKLIVGRGLAALRHESLLQSFLCYQLKNIFVDEDSMGGGSIFNAVTKEDMSNINFLVPNESLDRKFDELVGSLDKQIEILQSQIENLHRTRDLLLPRLISGEIEGDRLRI